MRVIKTREDMQQRAEYCRDTVIPAMNTLRLYVDAMEKLTGEDAWPIPSYGELLFGVH